MNTQQLGRPLSARVAVMGLCSPLEVGAGQAPAQADALARSLRQAGCDVVSVGVVDTPDRAAEAGRLCAEHHLDAIAAVAASWFEDYLVLDLLEEWARPLLLWSLPGMETGALCGVQQLTCYLRQLDHPFAAVFGPLESSACEHRALEYLRAAALHGRLRRARIGLAGHRVGGMTHTAPNEFMLKKAIGPRVVPLDLPSLLESAAAIAPGTRADLWAQTLARAGQCRVSEDDGLDSMGVYAALREVVQDEGLDALTVGCYPHLMGRVCLAASLLADEGVPMACEGDVNGAVGQLMLQLLTDQPTHHADWLNPLEDGSVVLTHCGSGSFSLAERPEMITLADVRLMGQGVCALFPSRPGPVTLLSLTPTTDGYTLAALEGEALPTEMVFPGNPVRVQFRRPAAELIDWIHAEGIGHHWAVGYGHAEQAVRDWASIAGPDLRLVTA